MDVQHLRSTMGYEEAVTSYIYMNRFDYTSIKINALKDMDSNHVYKITYNNTRKLMDWDVYKEYEIYIQKINQPNSIMENRTACNNSNDAKESPPTTVKEKMSPFHRIKNTNGDVIFVKQKMFTNFYHFNMLIPHNNDTYICLCCVETIDNMEGCRSHVETEKHKTQLSKQIFVIKFADNVIRRVQDYCFHCGICNSVISKKDLEDHIKTDKKHNTLKQFGEACAERILKAKCDVGPDLNKFINVQVADKKILLHKQYWHMYYEFTRKYFCSLCIIGGDIKLLQNHLDSSNHLTRLKKCQILPEYGLSVIRTLTENHHHCGVCNTYIIVDAVDKHIQRPKHKSNLTLWIEFTKQQQTESKENENLEDTEEKVKVTKEKGSAEKKVSNIPDDPEISNEDIIVEHNGSRFCLNILSFNSIVKAKTTFYCVCCSKHLKDDQLRGHMDSEEHKTALSDTQVVAEFAENFIRKTHGTAQVWAHCGFCNSRMTYNLKHVQTHIETDKHRNNLAQQIDKLSRKSKELAVTRPVLKNTIPSFISKSEKYSHEIVISDQKYNLNLHTFRAWHTIRGWGVYFSCCFACQTLLTNATMYRHTRSKEHMENLQNCVVLESYGTNYLQVINWSHCVYCTFCNDLIEFHCINSHVELDSHRQKNKCGITKLDNKDKGDSKLLIQLKTLLSQPLDLDIGGEALKYEGKDPEKRESDVKLVHSSRQECDLAVATVSSSKLSEIKEEHSIKTAPLKHQNGHVGIIQERTQTISANGSKTCTEFTKNGDHEIIELNYPKYIILEYLQDRILVTFNAWNTIVENTFCNTCKVNFITDTKSHCSEMKHITNRNVECYELSDGGLARKHSRSRIVCLLCDKVVKVQELNEHLQSRVHLYNLNNCKVSIAEVQSSHQYRETSSMNPVSVSVKRIHRKVSVQNREEPSEEYALLEFGNSKLMLTYNSWNGIVANKMTCHVCSNKHIMSNIESINKHSNDDKHKLMMRKKVIQANFIRKITKARFYCMLCNFIGNHAQTQEHIGSETHQINLKIARMQAASAADCIQVIDCAQYFKHHEIAYAQNVHKPVQTATGHKCIIVNSNSKESMVSEDSDSEDIWNGKEKHTESIEITNSPISVACEPACDDKETVKNKEIKKTIEDSTLSNSTVSDDGQFSATTIEFPQKTEMFVKTSNLSTSIVHKGDVKENKKSRLTMDNQLPAVPEADSTKRNNINNRNPQAFDVNAVKTEFCHICGMAVPLQFYTEHVEGKYHEKMAELMQTVLEKIKDHFNQICLHTNKCVVVEDVHYCSTCNHILGHEEFLGHSNSDLHKYNEDIISVIKRAVRVLQSSGDDDQLMRAQVEEHVSNESRSNDDIKVPIDIKKSEEADKLNPSMLVPNAEKPQHERDCNDFDRNEACSVDISDTNQTKDAKAVYSNIPRCDVDAAVVDATDGLITLQIEGRKIKIDTLSYHGIHLKPGNRLWCILCKVIKYDLDNHLISEKHLRRLDEAKFNGVDLIRYLSAFDAHCGLCHVMIGVTKLEDHLNSETHKGNRASATIDSEKESVQDDCTVRLIDVVHVQPQESNKSEIGQAEMISDGVVNSIGDIDNVEVLESMSPDRSLSSERNTSADTTSQSETPTETGVVTRSTVPSEVKHCSSTSYIRSAGCDEVPSTDETVDHEKSLRHVADAEVLANAESDRCSPSTSIDLNVASITGKPEIAITAVIKNDFIKSSTEAGFPYSCSLCGVKMSHFEHVDGHLKGAKHTQNLKRLKSNSINLSNESSGNDVGINSAPNHSTQNTQQSVNETIASLQNPLAIDKQITTTENVNERTCTICNVKVQKAIWEQHTQGKKHNTKLQEIMAVESGVQNAEKVLTDNVNALKSKSNIQTLSVNPNVFAENASKSHTGVKTNENEHNIASVELKPCSNSSYVCAVCKIQIPSITEKQAHEKTLAHINNLTVLNITENRNQSNPISQNAVPKTSSEYETPLSDQMKSDFISFVASFKTCPYVCSLCKTKMSSLQHVKQHLKGVKHMLNRRVLNDSVASTVNVNVSKNVNTDTSVGRFTQPVKGTMFSSLNSFPHVNVLKEPEGSTQATCTVCNVKVPIAIWEQHVQGKTHRSKLNQVMQINWSAFPGTTKVPVVKSEHSTLIANTNSGKHVRGHTQNTNLIHQSQSSTGALSNPPLVEWKRTASMQSSSSSQTFCTICNVSVPKTNMAEHYQGKVHSKNLKRVLQ